MTTVREDEFAPAVLLHQESGLYDLSLAEFQAGYALADARGLQGGGYTWQALMKYLVRTRAPEIAEQIEWGSEADTFVALSESLEAIRILGGLLKRAIEEPAVLAEAFEKASATEDGLE